MDSNKKVFPISKGFVIHHRKVDDNISKWNGTKEYIKCYFTCALFSAWNCLKIIWVHPAVSLVIESMLLLFCGFSLEGKCTITLELHRNNSYGYVKDKKEVGHELSKKSLGMVKVLMLKVPFQLSNVLNSPHVSLTEFTIGRIMSHFLMLPLLYFLLICMNLACLIINYWSTCHYECHLTFKTSSYASFLHSNHWYQFWRENSKWEPNKFSFS